ncbi:glutathione S-transferase [Xylariaceae sp. FL0594]|nr:glutathione S-transferase [Xylariaceae sp. FL0594]
MKPIKIWLNPPGPNPWKVVVVMQELGIEYEIKLVKHDHLKQKPFTDINPNGRVPAIEDPNTDMILWESGACIQYLIEQYDTKKALTYDTLKERHQLNQWLQFQMSGQGPYFGQAAWFNHLHHEKVESATDRYNGELRRVLGVLEGWLEERDWLVGDKMTYADLTFAPWNDRIDTVVCCEAGDKFKGFPRVQAWHERMTSRPAWKRSMDVRQRLMSEAGLDNNTGRPARFKTYKEYEEAIARGENTDP